MRAALPLLISLTLVGSEWTLAAEELGAARQALAEQLPEIAVDLIESFLSENKTLPIEQTEGALLLLGEAHLRSGNAKLALEILKRTALNESAPRSYWLGLAHAHLGNIEQALEHLTAVGPDSPLHAQATFNRIEVLQSARKWQDALTAVNQLQDSKPDYHPNDLSLREVQLLLAVNEPARAAEVMAEWKTEVQESPQARLLAGQVYLANQSPEKALEVLEKIDGEQQKPRFKNLVTLGRADALLNASEHEKALPLLIELLAAETENSFLSSLSIRFEQLITHNSSEIDAISPLRAFVVPTPLGEDSNFASPSKLLASYYLARVSPPESAQSLIQLALSLKPEPILEARLHLEQARLSFEAEEIPQARESLIASRRAAPQSTTAAQAADLLARLSASGENSAEAKNLFAKAAEHPDPLFKQQALLNQALLELAENPKDSLSALTSQLKSSSAEIDLELEKCLAKARANLPLAHKELDKFIAAYPEYPRLAEARLALLDLLLKEGQPDFERIEQELASLPRKLARKQSRHAFELCHRLGAIANEWTLAVDRGELHRREFPDSESDPFFLLALGESNFRNGDFNRAHLLFSETAEQPEAGELAEVALYFSARANLKIPTKEATEEAHAILDDLTQQSGRLATAARLLKARTLLKSQGKPRQCLETLEGIPGKPGDQPEAALLTAEAYRELTGAEPELFDRAISIYQRLIDDPRTSYSLSNQLHFQLALTYRECGKPELAIEPCLVVVDGENRKENEKETEWDYYYRCGFEAIEILLEAKRNQAALILARKLAQTKGPGAKQAQERAEQIQLDHLLWTD